MCNKGFKSKKIVFFFNKKYTFTICGGCVWIVIRYFLFENQTLNGLLKDIGIQKTLLT